MTETSNTSIKYLDYIPWLMGFALLMDTIDVTILNTAIPQMSIALGTPPLNLKIAITTYLLCLCTFVPISGFLADKYGTRKILIFATIVFLAGSITCGCSQNLWTLIAGRLIQGVGGALMMPTGRLILARLFHGKHLVTAFGNLALLGQLGPSIGPVIGGAITTTLGWRWVFFVNVPIGLVFLLLVILILPQQKQTHLPKFDWWGFVLFSLAMSALIFAITLFTEHATNYSVALGLFLISILFMGFYLWHARDVAEPLFPFHLFRVKSFRIATFGGSVFRTGLGGISFLLPLLFQLYFGFSPLYAGFLILPFGAGILFAKLWVTKLYERYNYRRLLITNPFIVCVLLFISAFMIHEDFYLMLLIPLFLIGMFGSFEFTFINALTFTDIEEKDKSHASSVAGLLQILTGAFGVCLCAGLLLIAQHIHHNAIFDSQNFYFTFVGLAIWCLISAIMFAKTSE